MIKEALKAVKTALQEIPELRYTGEDWGQLDYFAQKPVKFPCALVDLEEVDYTDNASRRQQAIASLTVRVADSQVVSGSFQSPSTGREFALFDLLQRIAEALHGLSGETFSPLVRTGLVRARRDDSVREFRLSFRFAFTDHER